MGGRLIAGGRLAHPEKCWSPSSQKYCGESFFSHNLRRPRGARSSAANLFGEFLRGCGRARKEDVVATAASLTARSIGEAVRRFVIEKAGGHKNSFREMILSGGGAKNETLVGMLREDLAPLGVNLRLSDEFGLPSEAKEAVAFAVLAYETWNRRPSNVPSATGAKRASGAGKDFVCVRARGRASGPWTLDFTGRRTTPAVRQLFVRSFCGVVCFLLLLSLLSCSAKPDPNTLVMIIESSPTNLDPRVGLDAQSERIDNLIFDDLLVAWGRSECRAGTG